MSKAIVRKVPDIDPEFRAVYEAEVMQGKPDSGATPSNQNSNGPRNEPSLTTELEALKQIAEENRSQYVDRKSFKDGSFDQVEHDISNTFRIGWRLLTRD